MRFFLFILAAVFSEIAVGQLVYAPTGDESVKFYGLCSEGGDKYFASGTLYSFDPANNAYELIHTFTDIIPMYVPNTWQKLNENTIVNVGSGLPYYMNDRSEFSQDSIFVITYDIEEQDLAIHCSLPKDDIGVELVADPVILGSDFYFSTHQQGLGGQGALLKVDLETPQQYEVVEYFSSDGINGATNGNMVNLGDTAVAGLITNGSNSIYIYTPNEGFEFVNVSPGPGTPVGMHVEDSLAYVCKNGGLGFGSIGKANLIDGTYDTIYEFSQDSGYSVGGPPVVKDSVLYVITEKGEDFDAGAFITIDLTGENEPATAPLDYPNGRLPKSGLQLINDTLIVGCTRSGGGENKGTLLGYSTNSGTLDALIATNVFNGEKGFDPNSRPALGFENTLFQSTSNGALGNSDLDKECGSLLSFDLLSSQTNVLIRYGFLEAKYPMSRLQFDPANEVFIGVAMYGGTAYDATSLRYDPNSKLASNSAKKESTDFSGLKTSGGLCRLESKFYGAMEEGGDYNGGVLYRSTAGSAKATIFHLDHDVFGSKPKCTPLFIEPRLHCTATEGGSNNHGTLFALKTNGTDSVVLHNFLGLDGSAPMGELYLDPATNRLFGITNSGGDNDVGVVYSIDQDGQNMEFVSLDLALTGGNPELGLTFFNDRFYAVCSQGGANGFGTIFSVETDLTDLTLEHSFDQSSGENPKCILIPFENVLYGTTYEGGNHDGGVIFSFDPLTNNYLVHHHFERSSGHRPLDSFVPVAPSLCPIGDGSYQPGNECNDDNPFTENDQYNELCECIGTPTTDDSDGDGIIDYLEQELGTNPFVADTDSDGIVDGDECPDWPNSDCLTDPLIQDSDGDGLTDGLEIWFSDFSTIDPEEYDTGQYGISDGMWVLENYNPCPADFTGDGEVNTADLLTFLATFNSSCP